MERYQPIVHCRAHELNQLLPHIGSYFIVISILVGISARKHRVQSAALLYSPQSHIMYTVCVQFWGSKKVKSIKYKIVLYIFRKMIAVVLTQ